MRAVVDGSSTKKQQALEQSVIQRVQKRSHQRQGRPHRCVMAEKDERGPETEVDDPNVFHAVVGEQALQIVLAQRIQHSQHARDRACGKHQVSPPGRGSAEEVKAVPLTGS